MRPSREAVSQNLSVPLISLSQVKELYHGGTLFVDVRQPDEVATGTLEGAVCIPHTEMAERKAEIEEYKEKTVVLFCRTGPRADAALQILRSAGFTELHNAGGYQEIAEAIEKSE